MLRFKNLCVYMDFCLLVHTWFTVVWCVVVKANKPTRAFTDTAPTVKVIVKVGWTIYEQILQRIN